LFLVGPEFLLKTCEHRYQLDHLDKLFGSNVNFYVTPCILKTLQKNGKENAGAIFIGKKYPMHK
jgi:rRNA-processing protein FCF1